MKNSIIIPVYKNEANIPRLLETLEKMSVELGHQLEVVFVVDGSPDQSFQMLLEALDGLSFPAQLLAHSRNFGSFPAIRSGLQAAKGPFFGVMAADLQEPPELLIEMFQSLSSDECDVCIGTRSSRADALSSRLSSGIFWGLYRRLIVKEMPSGGVDIFSCNQAFRDQLLRLEESRSSLIALIFWLGFRRKLVSYERQERLEGKSSWTLSKKIDYMMDSIFAFTDYPIRLLTRLGLLACFVSMILTILVFSARILGYIEVVGYTPTMLVVLFFGGVNMFGLGMVGTYAWRAYENTKQRPLAVVARRLSNAEDSHEADHDT